MNGAPKISVIIAAYNRAAFLVDTIDSVLQQQFRDLEVIVVNDGSTDDTEHVIACISPGDYRIRRCYIKDEMYPPYIAGPFETEEAALAALEVILS